MSRAEKARIIDELQEVLSKCSVGILTDYRGLTTAETDNLRCKFRESGIEYKVVKNTLAQFAARRAGRNELSGSFVGPVALVLGYGEISEPARVLADYIRTSKSNLSIKGGFLDDRLLTLTDVETLAKLPPRERLLRLASKVEKRVLQYLIVITYTNITSISASPASSTSLPLS